MKKNNINNMKAAFIAYCLLLIASFSQAQTIFIDKASIEFEVKTNNHKSFDSWFDNNDQENSWQENYKSNTSKFTISYYDYTFANNKSIYSFKKLDEKSRTQLERDVDYEGNIWYHDFTANTSAFARSFRWQGDYKFVDSVKEIKWKMVPNESRVIAGFNCRKAYTILFDSVYVFAFYTDEITISGGPVGLHGLPGMILGVTVPRMYTSWIATKISLNADEKKIVSPAEKKPKQRSEILQKFIKRAQEDENARRWMNPDIWNLFL